VIAELLDHPYMIYDLSNYAQIQKMLIFADSDGNYAQGHMRCLMKALDEIRSLQVIAEYLEYIRMVYDLSNYAHIYKKMMIFADSDGNYAQGHMTYQMKALDEIRSLELIAELLDHPYMIYDLSNYAQIQKMLIFEDSDGNYAQGHMRYQMKALDEIRSLQVIAELLDHPYMIYDLSNYAHLKTFFRSQGHMTYQMKALDEIRSLELIAEHLDHPYMMYDLSNYAQIQKC
jgi:hypothetical protein